METRRFVNIIFCTLNYCIYLQKRTHQAAIGFMKPTFAFSTTQGKRFFLQNFGCACCKCSPALACRFVKETHQILSAITDKTFLLSIWSYCVSATWHCTTLHAASGKSRQSRCSLFQELFSANALDLVKHILARVLLPSLWSTAGGAYMSKKQ